MKKIILLLAAILISNFSFSQKQGDFSFGLSDLDIRKPLQIQSSTSYYNNGCNCEQICNMSYFCDIKLLQYVTLSCYNM